MPDVKQGFDAEKFRGYHRSMGECYAGFYLALTDKGILAEQAALITAEWVKAFAAAARFVPPKEDWQ